MSKIALTPKDDKRHTTKTQKHESTTRRSTHALELPAFSALQNQLGNGATQRLLDQHNGQNLIQSSDVAGQNANGNHLQMKRKKKNAASFNILYSVPFIPQATSMSCWAASAAMLIAWRDKISINDWVIAAGLNYWSQYLHGLDPEDVHMFRKWGLTEEEPQCFTVEGFKNLLALYGPLWVAADADSAAGVSAHVRVVSGMYGDGTVNGTFLIIQDPAGKQNYVESYATYVQAQEELAKDEEHFSRPIYVAHL